MTRTLSMVCAGVWLFATSAHGAEAGHKEYGEPGVIEVGGTFSFESGSTDYDQQGKTTSSNMSLNPSVGYFVAKDIQVIGGLLLGSGSTKPEGGEKATNSTVGILAGGAYHIPMGGMSIGAGLGLLFINGTSKDTGLKITQTAPGLRASVDAKAPIGGGGLMNVGLFFQHLQNDIKVDFGGASLKAKGPSDDLGLEAGFSVFF